MMGVRLYMWIRILFCLGLGLGVAGSAAGLLWDSRGLCSHQPGITKGDSQSATTKLFPNDGILEIKD